MGDTDKTAENKDVEADQKNGENGAALHSDSGPTPGSESVPTKTSPGSSVGVPDSQPVGSEKSIFSSVPALAETLGNSGSENAAPSQGNENAHLLVHDDQSQREARETLKAISAAMTERNKMPLIRRDGLIQPETIMDSYRDQEPGYIDHQQPASTVEDLKKFRPQAIPLHAITNESTPSYFTEKEDEEQLEEEELPENVAEQALPEVKEVDPSKQAAPKGKGLDKKTLGVIAACSIVSGAIGIILGMSVHKNVVSSLDKAPDGNFGHGQAAPRPPGAQDFVGDIAANAMPTVVSVDTAPPETFEAFRRVESMEPGVDHHNTLAARKHSLGTGVVVRSDGYIVTSSHVVRGQKSLFVTLNSGRATEAKVVGRDPFTDIALLKIDATDLPVVRFAPPKSVRPGDWAIAIGTPFGFDHSVSLGVISAIGRSIADLNNHVDLIQTDAAMNPGNSGGPLLNSRGEVIGINVVVRSNAQNIGFAVPVDVVRTVANQLLAHGDIKRPFIGIFMEDMSPVYARKCGIDHGVVILRVVPESPAGKAGVSAGDVIIKLNDTVVESSKDARVNLQKMQPGDVLDFTFFRKGSGLQQRKVKVGGYPNE